MVFICLPSSDKAQLSSDLDAGPKQIKTHAATLQVVAIYVLVHFWRNKAS
jgi:hypothetical protein